MAKTGTWQQKAEGRRKEKEKRTGHRIKWKGKRTMRQEKKRGKRTRKERGRGKAKCATMKRTGCS